MNVAEMLLRLGCSLVAWMVVYAYCIWLVTLEVVGCEPGGDALWRLLLGFAPVVLSLSFLLTSIRPLPEVARILRWLAVPLYVLVVLAAVPVIAALSAHSLGEQPICRVENEVWHGWWAPVQIVALSVVSWRVAIAWRIADVDVNQ